MAGSQDQAYESRARRRNRDLVNGAPAKVNGVWRAAKRLRSLIGESKLATGARQ
jgi:hypothetical protein